MTGNRRSAYIAFYAKEGKRGMYVLLKLFRLHGDSSSLFVRVHAVVYTFPKYKIAVFGAGP
jgi:hypothetical protein